jgi:DNA-binding transcriptional regulator YdaS (Cro superfamily)
MNIFKLWMNAATPDEQKLLAAALGTSRGYLYQISGGFKQCSAQRGSAIERETAKMHRASLGRLPLVYRTDLVEACRTCEFAQKCLGAAAVRADFPLVTAEMVADSEGGTHD